ncbi:hypothetical protein [Pyxidicoccus caerfyrddinensis]|uniref:hypothetical protein n=1 Tax=Pyxidicoccus caerfyrddinensis TaxID=2709663 RepID=UPI0013DC711C|nr:hypothetical protein [Pyxidicoccus caerfyrddinensis]
MKIAGPRQNHVPSPKSSKTSEPGDRQVRIDVSGLDPNQRDGIGRSMRTGSSHSDNTQMVCEKVKPDGFDPAGKLRGRLNPDVFKPGSGSDGPRGPVCHAMRGPGSGGRDHGDNVLLGNDRPPGGIGNGGFNPKPGGPWNKPGIFERPGIVPPGKWHPIKPGGSSADNIFKGPFPGQGTPLKPPSLPIRRLVELLSQWLDAARGPALGGKDPDGIHGRPDRPQSPGLTHTDNVLIRDEASRRRE